MNRVEALLPALQRISPTRTVTAAASLWAAWVLLLFLVRLFTPQGVPEQTADATSVGIQPSGVEVDMARVAAWALFGATSDEPVAVVEEPVLSAAEETAEETKLALQLEGVILSDQEDRGRAVIAHKNAQDSYSIGDSLPVGRRVKLHRVLGDRVILDNQGKLESLLLYDESAATAAPRRTASSRSSVSRTSRASVTSTPRTPRTQNVAKSTPKQTAATSSGPRAPITRSASLLGASTSERVATLTNTVRITPSMNSGNQIVGYQISPANNARLFDQLGLRAGDVLTHVNGVSVGSISNVLEVYRIINRQDVADFTVVRGGQEQSLRLDLQR